MSQSLREPKEFRRSFIQKSGILAVGVAASALPATLLAKEKEE